MPDTKTLPAWRIRQLARGARLPDATPAERRAAAARKRKLAEQAQAAIERTDGEGDHV